MIKRVSYDDQAKGRTPSAPDGEVAHSAKVNDKWTAVQEYGNRADN